MKITTAEVIRIPVGVILLLSLIIATGCSVILGKEDAVTQNGLTFQFVESLRNEASLRGEGLRERIYSAGSMTSTLQQPNAVFADSFRVYVTDLSPARIFVFDRGDRRVSILDGVPPPMHDEVRLVSPGGITVDAVGTIYASDTVQGRVFGFDRNGKNIFTIGKMMEVGLPAGIVSDRQRGRLYVADTQGHRVKVFTSIGVPVYENGRILEMGATGRAEEDVKFPSALALDRSGNLYVLDALRRRVQVYSADGNFIRSVSIAQEANPGQPVKPKGIALDSDGHLYVTDMVSSNILLFDRDGKFLHTWGRTGSLNGDFWSPAGIFIDDRDMIYIADQTNGRVQVFQYLR